VYNTQNRLKQAFWRALLATVLKFAKSRLNLGVKIFHTEKYSFDVLNPQKYTFLLFSTSHKFLVG
jgi:hypothetical protein